jgi:hypothetical protein
MKTFIFFCLCFFFGLHTFAQTTTGTLLVAFEDTNKLIGFKDAKGTVVVPAQYGGVYFKEFFWKVSNPQRRLWGMMATDGKMLTEIKYKAILEYNDGLVEVSIEDPDDDYMGNAIVLHGLVNLQGQTVVECQYLFIDGFVSGWAIVEKFDADYESIYDYIDKTGKLLANFQYEDAQSFSENGLARVKVGDKYGFIDASGKLVIPAIYSKAEGFNYEGESVVQIELDGPEYTIDKTGKKIK